MNIMADIKQIRSRELNSQIPSETSVVIKTIQLNYIDQIGMSITYPTEITPLALLLYQL